MRKFKISSGGIPSNIIIVSSAKFKIPVDQWEDASEGDTIEAIPAFVVDADSGTSLATAKKWAIMKHKRLSGDYNIKDEDVKIMEDRRKNVPISGLRIVGLEKRAEGGRAYKVITQDGYYFDMREDVILDIMLKNGIDPGGRLRGDFVWGKNGSQIKLVRVGSDLYDAMQECTNRKSLPAITPKDFQVGGVYAGYYGKTTIFLGDVKTVTVHNNTSQYVYSKSKYMLFYDINVFTDDFSGKNIIDELISKIKKHGCTWLFRDGDRRSKSKYKLLKVVQLPDNIIGDIRNIARDILTKNILDITTGKIKPWGSVPVPAAIDTMLMNDSSYINLTAASEEHINIDPRCHALFANGIPTK